LDHQQTIMKLLVF